MKDKHVVGKKMTTYGCKMTIYQLLFFGSLPNSHVASGYIWGHNFWTNQDLDLSFVKDEHTYGKKMARNGPTTVIYKGTFVSNQSLVDYLLIINHIVFLHIDPAKPVCIHNENRCNMHPHPR